MGWMVFAVRSMFAALLVAARLGGHPRLDASCVGSCLGEMCGCCGKELFRAVMDAMKPARVAPTPAREPATPSTPLDFPTAAKLAELTARATGCTQPMTTKVHKFSNAGASWRAQGCGEEWSCSSAAPMDVAECASFDAL